MASEKLLNALNDQFNLELSSGYVYMAMAGYCSDQSMDGMAHFFIQQAHEEYEHAMKFYEFLYDIDSRVNFQAIPEPKNDYASYLEVFQTALAHEELVTSKIHNLLDMAMAEKSYPTMQFLQWFVEEQVEEETTMRDIIVILERVKDSYQGLYALDRELVKRED